MAGRVLDRQVRLGRPLPLRGLADDVSGPGFATAAGLLSWAGGVGPLADIDTSDSQPASWIGRAVNFIRNRL